MSSAEPDRAATSLAADEYAPLTWCAVEYAVAPFVLRRAAEAGQIGSLASEFGPWLKRSDVASFAQARQARGRGDDAPSRLPGRPRTRPDRIAAAEIVRLLYEVGTLSYSRLHQLLATRHAQSRQTLANTLFSLEEQGLVSHTVNGHIHLYSLADAETAVQEEVGWEEDAPYSGFLQLEDSGWWEGEPGEGLTLDDVSYRPSQRDARLTMTAVYDNQFRPCYWLSASEGYVQAEGRDGVRSLAELLIPAAAGSSLGEVGILVGRLYPPRCAEHDQPRAEWRKLAKWASTQPQRLGYLLRLYQRHHGLSGVELRERLAASVEAAAALALCLRPAGSEEEGERLVRYLRLAADLAGVPVHLLGIVVREAIGLEAINTTLGRDTATLVVAAAEVVSDAERCLRPSCASFRAAPVHYHHPHHVTSCKSESFTL